MEFYLIAGTLITLISAFPFIRLFFKRLSLYIRLKQKKNHTLESTFIGFFSPLRINEGFIIRNDQTRKCIKVYIVSAYNRRETLEFTNGEYRIKKIFLIMGGRVGASASFTWHTELKNIPDYLKKEEEESYILLSPAPLAVTYNGKEVYLGDKMLGKELINATNLIKRL